MGARLGWPALAAAIALTTAAGGAEAAMRPDIVLGGLTDDCSDLAEREIATAASIETCTMALLGNEPATPHDLAGTYVNRGVMYMAQMNWPAALSDFDQAISIYPRMGEAHVNRGAVLVSLERPKEALDELEQGIALGSQQIEKAYANRGLAKWLLKDVRGAYLDFLRAQELKPDWTWPRDQLANFRIVPPPAQ